MLSGPLPSSMVQIMVVRNRLRHIRPDFDGRFCRGQSPLRLLRYAPPTQTNAVDETDAPNVAVIIPRSDDFHPHLIA
jgi:hypothetical protein